MYTLGGGGEVAVIAKDQTLFPFYLKVPWVKTPFSTRS